MSRKECWLSLIFEQESEKIKPEARVRESCPPLTYLPPPPPTPATIGVFPFHLNCEIQGKKGKGYKSSNAKSEFLNNTCTTEKQNL